MPLDRRRFLVRTGLVLTAAGFGEELRPTAPAAEAARLSWAQVRSQF